MDEQSHLSLRYHGGEADQGQMGYYDTAASIVAFGDLVGELSHTLYGEKAYIRTTVQGAREGSFSIDFIIQFGGVVATILTEPVTPKDIWNLFKQSFEAWRFLDGKPPAKIERNGDQYGLTNVHGDVEYFNQNVFLTINSNKASEAIEQFVRKPLESGKSKLDLTHKDLDDHLIVTDKEAHAFTNVGIEEVIMEQTTTMALTVESAVFKEGNKWRFYDGQTSFSAPIEDEVFIERIDSGERFGKGDILIVEVYIIQAERKGRLVTERIVKQVLEHRIPGEQTGFL